MIILFLLLRKTGGAPGSLHYLVLYIVVLLFLSFLPSFSSDPDHSLIQQDFCHLEFFSHDFSLIFSFLSFFLSFLPLPPQNSKLKFSVEKESGIDLVGTSLETNPLLNNFPFTHAFRKLSHSFFIHTARKAALILTLFMPQWKGAHSRTAVLDQNKVESAAVFGFSWDSNSRQLAGHLSLFQLSISMVFFLKKKGRPLW